MAHGQQRGNGGGRPHPSRGHPLSPELAGILGVTAVSLGAISSGMIGLGFPIVAVPFLTMAYGLDTAVVVAAVPTLAIDLGNLSSHWSEARISHGLVIFAVASALGGFLGTLVRTSIPETLLLVLLAGTIAAYLVVEVLPRIDLRRLAQRTPTAFASGSFAGLLHATIAVSGPIVGMFFINREPRRASFIWHVSLVFSITGIVRLITLASVGDFSGPRLFASAGAAVLGVVLRLVGVRIGKRLSQKQFKHAVLSVLAASLVPVILRLLAF